METRNIAIMLTDIKGFTSKTSGFSRAETQEMLAKHRELVLPVIEKFGGRLVKTIGDAFLVAFNSPTDAVICGVEIQDVLKKHNSDKAQAGKIEIRIAINSGEVAIHDDGDIYGDAVNITARLESIAEAGEVFFTEAVYLAMNKIEVPSSEIGYRQFKGIPEKIKVFRVLREVPVGAQPPEQAPEESAPQAAPAAAPAVPAAPPLKFQPAGIFPRAVSLFIDVFIFAVIYHLIFRSVSGLPFAILFWAIYQSLFIKKKGATPGMLIMKLRLIELSTGLAPKRAFWRGIVGVLSALPAGLGYLWALGEKDHRTWHDLLTGTQVVEG
jgi:class 3 adenylate cyclase/uncharacterized RDD family membrane protein YckC